MGVKRSSKTGIGLFPLLDGHQICLEILGHINDVHFADRQKAPDAFTPVPAQNFWLH